MVNDFLDNLGARQHEKMMKKNASKEENYYNSESEGKDFKDAFYAPENYGTWQTQTQEETSNQEET